MAIKPIVVSEKTDEVPLQVAGRPWFVRVRNITRAHDRQLYADATVRRLDERTRQQIDAIDEDLHSLLYCRAAVCSAPLRDGEAHWRGLTAEMLAMLVELPEGYAPKLITETVRVAGEDQQVECVAFDPELAEFLWTEARRDVFQQPIYVHSQNVLLTTQLRKEAERGNWAGSSAA